MKQGVLMSLTNVIYLLTFYARDLSSLVALAASIALVIMGFYRASRGLALRNTVTSVGLIALIVGITLCTVPVDKAFFLSRVTAVEILVATVAVWLLSVIIQGYYGA